MKIGDTLYIVMPAYNESENLAESVAVWDPMLDLAGKDSRLLIVNDGSCDATGEVLIELQRRFPRLIFTSETNKGHGPAVIQAYAMALARGADYIFQTDSDNQTNPADFPDLWLRRGAYDVLAGRRGKRVDGRGRQSASTILSLVLLLYFHRWVKDANVPFRLYPRRILEPIIARVPEETALPNALLMAETRALGLRHYRKEIAFCARKRGDNSLDMKKISRAGMKALFDFARLRRMFMRNRKALKVELMGCQASATEYNI